MVGLDKLNVMITQQKISNIVRVSHGLSFSHGETSPLAGFLEEHCRALEVTVDEVDKARFGE